MAIALVVQLIADLPRKAVEDGTNALGSRTHRADLGRILGLWL